MILAVFAFYLLLSFDLFFFSFFLSAFQQGICTVQWVPCIVHGTHKYFIRKKN